MLEFPGKYTTAKVFIDNIDDATIAQIINFVNHEAFTKPVAIMPDTHAGKGAVIGFTMKMTKKIIPNVIGVDIGCGMLAMNLGKINLGSIEDLDKKVRQVIPFGSDVRDESFKFDDSFFHPLNALLIMFAKAYRNKFNEAYSTEQFELTDMEKMTQDMNMDYGRFLKSVGSLGGGNHFIEFSHDLNDDIWFTVHSGSRQFGTKVCNYWQKKGGKGELAYLEGADMYYYLVDMIIAQHYAHHNRYEMAKQILNILNVKPIDTIECIHNYVNFNDFIMRKGAVSSYNGERLIIPFNMEDGILICEGLSNEEWNNSAPHGSGRIGPRKLAKEKNNKEEASDRMKVKGIYASVIPIDETKEAYKDPKIIEDAIAPTAKIINRLRPILACKDKK